MDSRSKQCYRDEPIKVATIKKELETFGTVWRWGMRNGMIEQSVPWQIAKLTMPYEDVKEPFRTFDQIQRIIQRGEFSDKEKQSYWDGLYLTGQDVQEVLDLVAGRQTERFVYPMFAFVALTGARKSEMIRSEIHDFDFESGTLRLRGKKGRGKKKLVFRNVDIHQRLREAIVPWVSNHPGGKLTFCREDGRILTKDTANYHFGEVLEGSRWAVIKGFHVFRHSLASILASNGCDQRRIDEYLGHGTEEMRKRYQHLIPHSSERPIDGLLPP